MTIDLTRETPILLAQVPEIPWVRGRAGRRLHVATVHRWCSEGIGGRKLEFVQRGGTRVTTEPALLRFFQGLTEDRVQQEQDKQPAKAQSQLFYIKEGQSHGRPDRYTSTTL